MQFSLLKREYEIRRGFGRATLENIYAQIKDGQIKELRLIIKADVDGSAEVLGDTLGKIGTDEVRTTILHKGVGAVTETARSRDPDDFVVRIDRLTPEAIRVRRIDLEIDHLLARAFALNPLDGLSTHEVALLHVHEALEPRLDS